MLMDRFDEYLIPHIGVLYKMAFHLAGNRDDAEDMVQDVYIKARESFHTLKDHRKCKSWLCSILYRHFIDDYRRRRRFSELEAWEVDIESVPDSASKEDAEWPEHFSTNDISKALDLLDPRFRLPLVAHFLSGQSYQEIADSLDIPVGTVMSRIHRAKTAMRAEMKKLAQPSLRIVKGGRNAM
jgi:RNA polymerase sigma-70 factor (ECF subfamily)